MKSGKLGGVAGAALVALANCGLIAHAETAPAKLHRAGSPTVAPATAEPGWTGLYVGMNIGAAWGSYNAQTSTVVSPSYLFRPEDVAAVNAAGLQNIRRSGFAGGGQVGYNWQSGRAVFGLEADIDYLNLNGAANSGAVFYPGGGSGFGERAHRTFFPNNQFVVSSYAGADWLATVRPRLGIVADHWLFYATGGLALTQLRGQFLFTDGNAAGAVLGAQQQAEVNQLRAGYTVGGGVETRISDRLSLKAEYLFVDFGRLNAQQVVSNFATFFTPPAAQSFTQSVDLRANILRVGLNYHFGVADPTAPGSGLWMQYKDPAVSPLADAANWHLDVGTRLWLSSGTTGAPQPLLSISPSPSPLHSRLTYVDQRGFSGETFARADHSSGIFVKGFVGAGGLTGGTLIDEDFGGFGGAYSNTRSPTSGSLAYANVDVGYSFLKTPSARLGAFIGYNFYAQHINGFGCNQVAGDTTCLAANPNFQVFAEDDRIDSLRVGLSSDFMLTDKIKFNADAAYLPKVSFSGQDDHNLRELLLLESGSPGDGVMLESSLNYYLTHNWSVGIGGRYWAWNTRDGATAFDFLGSGLDRPQLSRFDAERYGVYLQTDYQWGGVAVDSARGTTMATKAPAVVSAPMDWTGFYIGGHVGGGWSDETWSDPFGSTPVGPGLSNVAGFGDTIHSTGPLGGLQAGLNWQTGHWVLGLEAEWSAADLRGENTCFSGIGGVNCQDVVKWFGSVAGRVGFAWDRSLIYAKAGVADAERTYTLNGDTASQTLGIGTSSVNSAGWMVGGGVEYAITNHWTTFAEYEYADLGSVTASFPNVALTGAQQVPVKQSVETLKLGVNYKFDWSGPLATR